MVVAYLVYAYDRTGAVESCGPWSLHIGSMVFRETQLSDIESLFSVRARTRENALSGEQLALIGISPRIPPAWRVDV